MLGKLVMVTSVAVVAAAEPSRALRGLASDRCWEAFGFSDGDCTYDDHGSWYMWVCTTRHGAPIDVQFCASYNCNGCSGAAPPSPPSSPSPPPAPPSPAPPSPAPPSPAPPSSSYPYEDCCDGCHSNYCSPQSAGCYDTKAKSYYLTCEAASSYPYPDCCDGCSSDYCSPESGSCYGSQAKSYYLTCSGSAVR